MENSAEEKKECQACEMSIAIGGYSKTQYRKKDGKCKNCVDDDNGSNNNNNNNSNQNNKKNHRHKNRKGEFFGLTEEEIKQKTTNVSEEMNEYPSHVIKIDGSMIEGGGQILRNTVSLSALTKESIAIFNIRKNRKGKGGVPSPGLRAQHLKGIELVSHMFNGNLKGNCLNSESILFEPGNFGGTEPQITSEGNFDFCVDTKTAGSISLLIQISLLPALFTDQDLDILLKGGTNTTNSPHIDYCIDVFKPIVSKFGLEFDIEVIKRGYYPKGGGIVTLKTKPAKVLTPITLVDKGEIIEIAVRTFFAGNAVISQANEIQNAALEFLDDNYIQKFDLGDQIEIKESIVKETNCHGNATGIIMIARSSTGCLYAGSSLGRRNLDNAEVGKRAAAFLVQNLTLNGCVDEYLTDQLIIYMALSDGKSQITTGVLSDHTLTSIEISKILTGAVFTVTKNVEGNCYLIECDGIGYTNKYLL